MKVTKWQKKLFLKRYWNPGNNVKRFVLFMSWNDRSMGVVIYDKYQNQESRGIFGKDKRVYQNSERYGMKSRKQKEWKRHGEYRRKRKIKHTR